MIRHLIILLIVLPISLFAQTQERLTANQIIDSSLVFCGGEQRISKLKTIEIDYFLTQPDETTAVLNDKLKIGEKYSQCILSKTHYPQTTFFDGKKISRVDGNSVTHTTDLQLQDETKLRTYSQVQYAYKKLKYELSRLPDQKFKNFDCFVITAKADNGYATVNFFDKSNYRLLMIMYPNGNKSAMVEYVFKDSVLFNSRIVNTFAKSKDLQTLYVQKIALNVNISDTWFNCPYSDKVFIPDYIQTGKFVSSNGEATTFTRNKTSMDYTDDKGIVVLRRLLAWGTISPDTFGLIDEEALKKNDKSSSSEILVRIVSWDEHGYVCQWMTDKYTGSQDYKIQ